MPADDTLQQPFVPQVIDAAPAAVPLPRGIDERQIARQVGRQKTMLERGGQRLGMARSDEPAGRDRRAVADQRDGLVG